MGGVLKEVLKEVLHCVRAVRSRQRARQDLGWGNLQLTRCAAASYAQSKASVGLGLPFVARRSSCYLILLSRNCAQRDFYSAKILARRDVRSVGRLVSRKSGHRGVCFPQIALSPGSSEKRFYWQEILLTTNSNHYKFCSQEMLLPNGSKTSRDSLF